MLQLSPVLRYLGFACLVVPIAGVGLWYAIGIPSFEDDPSTGWLVALALPIVAAALSVVVGSGQRRAYPHWLIAAAVVGAVAMAVPALAVVGFGIIVVSCPLFDTMCLG